MAEFARWQWDDIGTWRDFAEQYQALMESAFQKREPVVSLDIPPFGTFRMDLLRMQQITVKGRNPGYERDIRRQARRFELGYFLRGVGGELFASDAAVDQIEDEATLEALAAALRRIVEEPEEFSYRSLNLDGDELCGSIGACKPAQEVLTDRGFELISEGRERFLVFMDDRTEGLIDARKEVESRLDRLRRSTAGKTQEFSNNAPAGSQGTAVEPEFSNNAPAGSQGTTVQPEFSNDAPAAVGEPTFSNAVPDPAVTEAQSKEDPVGFGRLPSRDKEGDGIDEEPEVLKVTLELPGRGEQAVVLPGTAALGDLLATVQQAAPSLRLPLVNVRPPSTSAPENSAGAVEDATSSSSSPGKQQGRGTKKSKKEKRKRGGGQGQGYPSNDVTETEAAAADGEVRKHSRKRGVALGLALGAEPGKSLWEVYPQCVAAPLTVEDFGPIFSERLQNGLLRLQDLAIVAPLLDWDRPELTKVLLGRARALLEEPCDSWCEAADCDREEELLCGRALLRHVYGDLSLKERLRVCRELLPAEKRDKTSKIQVDRNEHFLAGALGGLMSLSKRDLCNPLAVQFRGEIAEDHGGPRRDFFALLGSRLCAEGGCEGLWRRLPRGAMAPVPDMVAEGSPKESMANFDTAEAGYRACGRACGLATRYGDVLGEEFAAFFLHQVARDDTVGLNELQRQLSEAEGPEDVRASSTLLHRPLAETGLMGVTLSRTITRTAIEVDLVPGGRSVPVTDENKELWLRLHLHDKLYGSLRKAAEAFREGLLDVFGGSRRTCPLLVLVSPGELARVWAGNAVSDEDVGHWRDMSTVSGEVAEQAAWLFQLLSEGDEEFRSRVLKFSTGAGKLAHSGLQTFEVQPADGGDEALPRAMTCANMLQLPRYSSRDALDLQLRKAMELCDGFQIL